MNPIKFFIAALITSSLGLGNLFAQPVISSTDMPLVDTIYQFHTASNQNVDFSITGADVVWDYTALINTGFSQDSFVNPISTPLVYQLVFNNFLLPAYDATHAQPGSGINLPAQIPFEVTNVSNFYKNTSSSFKMVGFGATINSIPAPIQYQGADVWYKFPLGYGNIDTSQYSFEINVPTLGYWKQAGTRMNHVDGFGTLILPGGYSYDVIRLKSEIEMIDSLHIDQFGFTIPIPRNRTEYKFMAVGEKEPVLQITTQPMFLIFGPETVIGVRYKNEMNLATIQTHDNSKVQVYPNPASNFLIISDTQNSGLNQVLLLNNIGQPVYKNDHINLDNLKVDVTGFANGVYYLVAQFKDGSSLTEKVVLHP